MCTGWQQTECCFPHSSCLHSPRTLWDSGPTQGRREAGGALSLSQMRTLISSRTRSTCLEGLGLEATTAQIEALLAAGCMPPAKCPQS